MTDTLTVNFVVPLFRSSAEISRLFKRVQEIADSVSVQSQLTLVFDGPDDRALKEVHLFRSTLNLPIKVIELSRNFSVGPALMAGLSRSDSTVSICMGSDLQEPAHFFTKAIEMILSDDSDIVLGARRKRWDGSVHALGSFVYWRIVRHALGSDIPAGGFDVFAISSNARSALISLPEVGANITHQLFWIGFRRKFLFFDREPRLIGKSTWTLRKKAILFWNSVFGLDGWIARSGALWLLLGSVLNFVSALVALFLVQTSADNTKWLIVTVLCGNFCLIFLTLAAFGFFVGRLYEQSRGAPSFLISREVDL